MVLRLIAVVLLVFPIAARADDTAERTVAAWTEWAEARGIDHGQIVVAHEGQVRATGALGGSSGAVDLASLSKAITALCVADLVAAGQLGWDDPVAAHLPDTPAPLAGVSVAQLVTHAGGLTPDSTQGAMPAWRGSGAPVYAQVIDGIATRPLEDTTMRYNNENYAGLAEVITAASGASYSETCARTVLADAPSAVPSPSYGRFAAWGGWRMDLAEYAALIWARYGALDPSTLPAADLGGVQYGLGMVWRAFRGGHNHWHFGALCFEDDPGFFTFTVLFANGWGAVTHVRGCPQDDWFGTLDGAIVGAIFR